MLDYYDLKEDVSALDNFIQVRLKKIESLMEALKSIRTLSDETALLQELTVEIVALRDLRQKSFTRKSLLREQEKHLNACQDNGRIVAALTV